MGQYFELPIVGLTIQKIVFGGLLKLIFNDAESSFLELHSTFKVTQYNQIRITSPKDKEGLIYFTTIIKSLLKNLKLTDTAIYG